MKVKLPFEPITVNPFEKSEPEETLEVRQTRWLEGIKAQARRNVKYGLESIRVAWTHEFKKPKYDRFEDYTPEEAVLELWEQHYYKNPNSLEMQGLQKLTSARTGQKYYKTGDATLDAMEEAFARGETPDLSKLDVDDGEDIFKSKFFNKRSIQKPSPEERPEEKSEKISQASGIKTEDYQSNSWINDALIDDPDMQEMVAKLGVPDAKLF